MVEIPPDQDSWLGEVDHTESYESAGLDTGENGGEETEQSRAAKILDALGL